MRKVISPRVHGVLDYGAAASLGAVPTAFSITGLPAQILYGLGVFSLFLAVTSKAPPGLIKIVPMRIHALIELVSGPIIIALPWLMGFASDFIARYVFVAFGAGLLVFWLITDYEGTSLSTRTVHAA
jgi:hypothetical protein